MVQCCDVCHYILPKGKEGRKGLTHIGCLDKECNNCENNVWVCDGCNDLECCNKECFCHPEESDQEESEYDSEYFKESDEEESEYDNEIEEIKEEIEDNKFSNSTIMKNIKVPSNKLHIYEDYIIEQIKNLEGKNYSNEIGYINKLVNIVKIDNNMIEKNNFCGSIIYRTEFIVEHYNPQIGDKILCKVIQNSNILICEEKILKIIVINEKSTEDLQRGDKIMIKILCKEINYNSNIIKIVGNFISKI